MNFAFAGTPQLGAWVLRDLIDCGRVPSLVVSQPDRPAGRGRHATPPEVVGEAIRQGLPVHQTGNINDDSSLAALREAGAEVLVVAAFGQLLRSPILDGFLCVNVHASLLPLYRGAAPIARALMDGCEETGVTIMRMSPGLDEGPWAEMKTVSIGARDDTGSLSRTLALLGAVAVDQVLTGCAEGTVTWREQQGEATYARKLERDDRVLDLSQRASICHDRVRALAPDVGCEIRTAGGQVLKVWRTWPWVDGSGGQPSPGIDLPPVTDRPEGELLIRQQRLFAACADGWLELLALQPSGKKTMSAAEFLRGYERRLGGRLLPPPEPGPAEQGTSGGGPSDQRQER